MRRIAVLGFCVAATFAGSAFGQSKATIQKLNDEWTAALNRGDAAAVAAMYAVDAYLLPPGGDMVQGRKAIEAFWKKAATQVGDARLVTMDVQPLGRGAAREIGTVELQTKAQPPQQVVGKYAVVWRRIGGKWLLETDIWNMNK